MNNPLELLLRKQKMAQGGRIRLGGGGTMGSKDRGYQGRGNPNSNTNNSSNNDGGGSHGGNDPQSISAQQMMSAEPDDYGGFNPNIGGGGPNQQPTTPTTTTTPVQEEDEVQYTNNIIEALFTDMKFKYDPKMDYVKGKYGNIPSYKKQQFLDSIGYTEDFDSFLNEYKDDIYNDQNITMGDIGQIPTQVYEYFTGIPNAINTAATNLTQPGAYQTMAENVFSGVFNPITSFMSGNLPMMFASLAFGKGPYTQESITSGNYADLTNAPADYREAVKDAMGGSFNAEQISQMAQGFSNQQEQQAATQGPQVNPMDQAMNQVSLEQKAMEDYVNNLNEYDSYKYNQLIQAGYTDDYARAYLGLM